MFTKGNELAKLKGKHKKTKQWEALGEAIVGEHADAFNRILKEQLEEDPDKFTQNYLNVLNYFRPKHQSTVIEADIVDKRKQISDLFPEELDEETDQSKP